MDLETLEWLAGTHEPKPHRWRLYAIAFMVGVMTLLLSVGGDEWPVARRISGRKRHPERRRP